MSAFADQEPVRPQHQQRLAEAARYAVLQRLAPVLRHDVAGFLQPVGMLTKVLQRRVQMADPDLPEISKNLASISALVKEASTGCMNAMGWMVSGDDKVMGLHSGVNEAIKMLEPEFFSADLALLNGISDEQASAPQAFLRNVFVGALLAFCDQRTAGNTLQVTLEEESGNGDANRALLLRMLPGDTVNTPASTDTHRQSRSIDWQDVEAMAGSFKVTMARGEGWLRLGLP